MNEPEREGARYPLRAVMRRTGLSADVLRAWERRYGAVRPVRSSGGQRLYSADDLERLSLLQRATAARHSIREIARLDRDALERLLDRAGRTPTEAAEPIAGIVRDLMSAVERLDAGALEAELKRAALQLGSVAVVDDILPQVLRVVGDRWHRGALTPAHEHLATQAVRSVLVWLSGAFEPRLTTRRVVIATPAREQHELGAMLVAAAAAGEGWSPIYLGPNLPAMDIAAAAEQVGASVVALSIVYVDSDATIQEIRETASRLPGSTLLVIGGTAAARLERALDTTRIRVLPDLAAFRALLRERAAAATTDEAD